MVKRLLSALEYPDSNVNINDESNFRRVIAWLETNKIRRAYPQTESALKNVNSSGWYLTFDKYKDEIGCPALSSKIEELQWILGLAAQIETSKNRNLYLKYAVENIKTSNVPSVVAENPLDKLDFRSSDFQARINQLAKSLKIVPHPDALVTLKAVRKVVCQRLSPSCVENPEKILVTGTPFPYQDAQSGFDLNDNILNQAAKILRMLYIHDLRDLQTKANELIVAVQNVTANPKTDTKLGKVGF